MTISFNQIPSDRRVPFVYIEFDNKRAIAGPQTQPYKVLHIGQKIAAGTQAIEVPVQVTSVDQAAELFGKGSILHHQLKGHFVNNTTTETWAVALADDGASVKAAGSFAFTGTATASGTFYAHIGGYRVKVGVTSGDVAADVAQALKDAIDADDDLPVTATINAATVTVTAKNGGVAGNYIDLRHSYYDGEGIPAGIAVVVTAMSSGSANPDVADALAVLGPEQYNVIVMPWTDQANLTALHDELVTRWGPLTQNDGRGITAANVSFANLTALGNAQNSPHLTIAENTGSPTLPWEFAGGVGAVVAFYAAIDPARPFQTLQVKGTLPPKVDDRFTADERNLLLYDGIATTYVDAGGAVRVERLITTYQKNEFGAADASYLDLNTMTTLSYLRYDLRNYILTKYPRHKLANDGTRFGSGQAIVTPKIAKSEMIARFRQWEELGLVEDADQFKTDLIVERNVSDPNRLDVMLPPNLVNQLRVTGVQIGFIL